MLDQVSDPRKDALRIQAAAVAAQQAALTEEEIRLHKRRAALEQHEAQLAAHLDEKRQRLIELRTQAREAQAILDEERAAFESRVHDMRAHLAEARAEAEVCKQQALTERQRLLELRQRLKKRWHRHWAAERAALRQQQADLVEARRELQREQTALAQKQEHLECTRLQLNGEIELGRRRLQDGWSKLHQAQAEWQRSRRQEQQALRQRGRELTEREWAIHAAIRTLAEERRRCQVRRLHLEQETAGLDARIANQRRLVNSEQTLLGRPVTLADVIEGNGKATSPTVVEALKAAALPPTAAARHDLLPRLSALEKLSIELADQRVHLTEQCERLLQTQQKWEQDHDQATAELEQAGALLRQREVVLIAREQDLEELLARHEQQQAELKQVHHHLESWQARLAVRTADWDGERQRLLADVDAREARANQRLNVLLQIGRRWQERRHEEVRRLRANHAACQQLYVELTRARNEWLQRHETLSAADRAVAERLALLDRSVAAEPSLSQSESDRLRLHQFQKQLAALSTAAEKALAREYQALRSEATRIEERFSQLQEHAQAILTLESQHAERLRGWELGRRQVHEDQQGLRHEYQRALARQHAYELQVRDLNDEVERLARALLDSSDTNDHPLSRAA